MPDGFPPFMNPFDDGDLADETVLVARALFAAQHHCLSREVDAMLDDNPVFQAEFDDIMDFIARDGLLDDCNMAVVDTAFIHLSDLGLVNASSVKVVAGVAIPTHSPYQIEHALGRQE